MTLAWALALALAQQPAPDEEVVVYGQLAVDKARDALVHEMERLGWRKVEKRDGTLVFRAPQGWMGKATFDPELASLDFRRPAAGIRLADYDDALPAPSTADPGGMPYPASAQSGAGLWLLPRKKKVDPVWHHVRQQTADELATYRKVVDQTALQARLQEVPVELDALWAHGTPIDAPAGPLVPEAERLSAVLDFWATRVDTPEGLRVTRAVEAWLEAHVESIPEDLAAAAEARREDGRALPR